MPTSRPLLALAVLPAVLIFGAAVPANAERWVGHAYSDYGYSPKIVLRGRTWFADDGTVGFSGRFRCFGDCLGHRGWATVAWWNDADGFGHQAVEVDLWDGSTCWSNAWFESAFEWLPPAVGTWVIVRYECEDEEGYEVDSGTVDVTRVR